MAYTQEEIKREQLDQFPRFLREIWHYLMLPKPTPVQDDIADYLQKGPRRMVIEAFRGVGKSWITAAFVCWLLFSNPELKVLVVSASKESAAQISKFIKQLIHGVPVLQHLQPRREAGHADSAIIFDVGPARASKDPSVKCAGITGQITGSRADVIVSDDVEIPKNSLTHLMRERLAELVKEYDAILKPGGRVIYLGTPQVEASLYNRLPERGYEVRIWPIRIPERTDIYHGRLAPFITKRMDAGWAPLTPIEPTRFPESEIAERLLSFREAGFALQFMLDTNPADQDKHPLRTRDLIVYDCDREMGHVKMVWGQDQSKRINDLYSIGFDGDFYVYPTWKSDEMTKYTGTVMAIDPSGRGQDETAYAIVRNLHGMLYLVDGDGFKDGFSEATLNTLALRAIRYGVNYIIDEPNYGGGMFRQLLKPVVYRMAAEAKLPAPTFDEEYDGWSTTQKELRILDTLEPIVQSHRLIVDRGLIERDFQVAQDKQQYSLMHQFTRMARIKGCLAHEDRLEAVSMACNYWIERMKLDKDKALENYKSDAIDKELRRFAEGVHNLGRAQTGAESYPYRWTRTR